MHPENIRWMQECPQMGRGMDVLIISTETKLQEEECQHHLESLLGELIKPTAKVIAVCEDWPGGAGNGLGTLYAYHKARLKALARYGVDIFEMQKRGAAVALYHTGGQGKRLSPLTGSERNNKSAVKLPAYIGRTGKLMTLLDAVIKQTAIFAQSRKGRLSVFWGDQLFIPSNLCAYKPLHHVDILVQIEGVPSSEEWQEGDWEHYGLVGTKSDGDAQIVEKPSFAFFQNLMETKKMVKSGGIGRSLGSFSLSASFTFGLFELFREELQHKRGHLDSDVFLWMAMTLDHATFRRALEQHNYSAPFLDNHYDRMQDFKLSFHTRNPEMAFFGAADIGQESYWWDYGTVDNYFKNNLKLTSASPEGEAMRHFFGHKLDPATRSIILQSSVPQGKYQNCVIVGSKCDQLDAKHTILIHSDVGKVQGEEGLLYNVSESDKLQLQKGSIRADVFIEERHVKLHTHLGRDGRADWTTRLPANTLSYEEVYRLNQNACHLSSIQ